ncbi:MAG: hypothetical protein ACI4JM_10610, partial [Oscillospiraceae bacterium]
KKADYVCERSAALIKKADYVCERSAALIKKAELKSNSNGGRYSIPILFWRIKWIFDSTL